MSLSLLCCMPALSPMSPLTMTDDGVASIREWKGHRMAFVSPESGIGYEGVVDDADEEAGQVVLVRVSVVAPERQPSKAWRAAPKRHGLGGVVLVVKLSTVTLVSVVKVEGDLGKLEADEKGRESDEDGDAHEDEEDGDGCYLRKAVVDLDPDSGFQTSDGSPSQPSSPESTNDKSDRDDKRGDGLGFDQGATSRPVGAAAAEWARLAQDFKEKVALLGGAAGDCPAVAALPRPPKWSVPLAMKKKDFKTPRRFPDYAVPEILVRLLDTDLEETESMPAIDRSALEDLKEMLQEGLTAENYKRYLSFLLYAEENQVEKDMAEYNLENAVLRRDKDDHHMYLRVPGVADRNPNVLKGDLVCFFADDYWYELTVCETYQDKIFFERDVRVENDLFPDRKQSVRKGDVMFTVNRSTFCCMHRSIGLIQTPAIRALFPEPAAPTPAVPDAGGGDAGGGAHSIAGVEVVDGAEVELYNEDIRNNEEQLQAVCHIVAGTAHPHPYILFGPPGTGKTVTLVEAIKQVHLRLPRSRAIVCAPSNTAADLLASRLVADVPESDLLRLVAPSREGIEVDEALDDVIIYGKIKLQKLKKFRVVVVTLSTAGRLVSAGISKGHFTHVFVDEAGQATEPESIIPLAGLLDPRGRVVLSGDPNQLGPVNMCKVAKKHGLDTSMLERLMTKCDLYKRDTTGARNPRVITKLLKNFRSARQLLSLPSRLFYDNELQACKDGGASSAKSKKAGGLRLCRLPWLPRKDFPLVFHGVVSPHRRTDTAPSLFNDVELAKVSNYAAKLARVSGQHDVGVVSPYRTQVRKIKEELHRRLGWTEVLVGSAEEFQGQERDAMILSTVRSSLVPNEEGGGLGFLTNAKRFNVAITRAKSLLIVVGDPWLLKRDKNWKELIRYALENGSYVGCKFGLENLKKNKKKKKAAVAAVSQQPSAVSAAAAAPRSSKVTDASPPLTRLRASRQQQA